ncbi:MAG TPA: hypothetical protein VEA15_05595 [Caulobacteraceae bacterium]|nr:hypothetical protein [Caulobacteraceae bacterium]
MSPEDAVLALILASLAGVVVTALAVWLRGRRKGAPKPPPNETVQARRPTLAEYIMDAPIKGVRRGS